MTVLSNFYMADKNQNDKSAFTLVEPPPIIARPRPKKRKTFLAIAAIVAVLAALAWAVFFRQQTPPITVQTEKVARRNITETVVANGKIYPVVQVHISAEVSGEITSLPVKEGQVVKKGDLLLKINPILALAALNQAKASYASSLASKAQTAANVEKADADYNRNKELSDRKLISDSDFISFKVARDVVHAQLASATNQVEMAKAAVDSAQDSLDKTTIIAPMDGTITKLNSQLGERVLGTVQNAGTDIMIISDLSQMEARVDIGEMDVLLIHPGEKAKLSVDAFKDKKITGAVTDVANSSQGFNTSSAAASASSSSQSATQFQVRIRVNETGEFHPGMSVTAEIETRTSTNALAAPIASVTTRATKSKTGTDPAKTNSVPASAPAEAGGGTNGMAGGKITATAQKPVDVVFVVEGNHVKTVPVKIGISDDNYWEVTEGLKEGDEIVIGGYRAISRDLDDGKIIVKGTAVETAPKKP